MRKYNHNDYIANMIISLLFVKQCYMIDIKRFRKEKGISQQEICTVLGIKQPYLSSIENGKRPLNEEKFTLLYKQYGDIILNYKTTEKPILLIDEVEASLHPNIAKYLTERLEMDKAKNNDEFKNEATEYTTVPLLPIAARGGSLNDFVMSIKSVDCEKIISPITGVDFAITVTGDSMSPEYSNGSRILIKRINEKAFIDWGRVYVLDTCNGTVIKKIMPGSKEDRVKCESLNEAYPPFEVCFNDMFGMYRVLMLLSEK